VSHLLAADVMRRGVRPGLITGKDAGPAVLPAGGNLTTVISDAGRVRRPCSGSDLAGVARGGLTANRIANKSRLGPTPGIT